MAETAQQKYDEASCEGISSFCLDELKRATRTHGRMKSPHEGYAVIKEEFEELWAEIKTCEHWNTDGDARDRMRTEASQVAAMAMRFILDICSP